MIKPNKIFRAHDSIIRNFKKIGLALGKCEKCTKKISKIFKPLKEDDKNHLQSHSKPEGCNLNGFESLGGKTPNLVVSDHERKYWYIRPVLMVFCHSFIYIKIC